MLPFADDAGKVVEGEALVATDEVLLVVVLPGSKEEELTTCTKSQGTGVLIHAEA